MKKAANRFLALLLVVCILLGNAVLPVQASNPGGVEFLNTYVNTGNQRQDIIGVAMTQLGYMELYENDTKYGDWYGYPGLEWCAMFVSWCARQADVSTDIIKRTSWAHPNSFGIPYYHGTDYTPKPGDLFFTETFGHVGLVLSVEGEFFYGVEGNAKYHDYTVPDDPEVDSYHVMTNKRLISAHYFGVPDYEGDDETHAYEKGHESAHPHKTYYECVTCGDKYYTGYTECVAACSQCFTCGCSSSHAGYYLVSSGSGAVKIRASHSTSASYVGYATVGEAVYVHGADPETGWAYIEYDGLRGHIQMKYLTAYHDIPAAPEVTSEKTDYILNSDVTVRWDEPANTEQYRLKVFKDGVLYLEENMDLTTTRTLESLPVGAYQVQVLACNRSGASEAGVLEFVVRDTYLVSYDACGGSGAPADQSQVVGEPITLSTAVPVREGYTFLGWTENAQVRLAEYDPGAVLPGYADMKLYAVWKSDDALPQSLTIERLPACTVYLTGEALDPAGLVLRLTYSDGSGRLVTQGYSTEGFDSETCGTKTVTVAYDSLTAVYDVQVVPYIPGDIDLNRIVDRDDVLRLLWHISFPDRFTIEVPADFNTDGSVNRDDVLRLLWHVAFPDRFPLEIVWPEEAPPAQTDTGEGGGSGSGEEGE